MRAGNDSGASRNKACLWRRKETQLRLFAVVVSRNRGPKHNSHYFEVGTTAVVRTS